MLFTHRGLSGPAILQISSYWRPGEAIEVDMAPGVDVYAVLRQARAEQGRSTAVDGAGPVAAAPPRPADRRDQRRRRPRWRALPTARLRQLGDAVNAWRVKPVGSEGYRTAEVTVGGVDTRDLDFTHHGRARPCPASISSARWSTSPAGSAATISSGPGPAAGARGRRSDPGCICVEASAKMEPDLVPWRSGSIFLLR